MTDGPKTVSNDRDDGVVVRVGGRRTAVSDPEIWAKLVGNDTVSVSVSVGIADDAKDVLGCSTKVAVLDREICV